MLFVHNHLYLCEPFLYPKMSRMDAWPGLPAVTFIRDIDWRRHNYTQLVEVTDPELNMTKGKQNEEITK